MRFARWMATAGLLLAACGGAELTLPAEGELEGLYGPTAEVGLNGNVVDVTVQQPYAQIARGGDLWARVGPYIYLFSPQTRELFRRYDGVAAVRVRTFTGGSLVAEALLPRDTMTAVAWEEATRRVGRARLEGTENPRHLEDLIRFGHDWTRYEYAPPYAPR